MAFDRKTILDFDFTQQKWVERLTKTLSGSLENDIDDIPVCVFRVPISLCSCKPEAYTPQLVALGPYHHLISDLYDMERYKIVWAKEASQQLNLVDFNELIDHLKTLDSKIKSSYRGRLNLNKDTLALIMTIDGLFLLHLLKHKEIPHCSSLSSSLLLNSSSGKHLPSDAILRDVLMLENQIPRFVLKEILTKSKSRDPTSLETLYRDFCKMISPIKLNWSRSDLEVLEHHHLLDFLYQHITYKKHDDRTNYFFKEKDSLKSFMNPDIEGASQPTNSSVFSKVWSMLSLINIGVFKIFKKFVDLFLNVFGYLGLSTFAFLNDKKVLIPSVSELWNARMRFSPITGGTSFVKFDERTHTLHLPVITLNSTSEVVIRNLVAYEIGEKSGSLNFRRFSELMGAIVDTAEDVAVLKKAKVIESDLSNAEVAEIFNGFTRTMESKDGTIDTAIKKANAYYDNTRKVRIKRLLKKYIYSSWKILTVLASILLLLLMGLQTFCDIYRCPNMFAFSKANDNI
ncbi:hypothetical protein SLEP1_g1917 [Rubroshorea leprosula]|uniref:Uncharacterized protein n=1 Tax=Rubroshorea leprosula TaxID=152421 RepID=A0AAV5HL63_9ROSI|nr:hypothetical protein SLEP1_g1917 [Rubroshorea leprosula]